MKPIKLDFGHARDKKNKWYVSIGYEDLPLSPDLCPQFRTYKEATMYISFHDSMLRDDGGCKV